VTVRKGEEGIGLQMRARAAVWPVPAANNRRPFESRHGWLRVHRPGGGGHLKTSAWLLPQFLECRVDIEKLGERATARAAVNPRADGANIRALLAPL
jgi:hypothetical protein